MDEALAKQTAWAVSNALRVADKTRLMGYLRDDSVPNVHSFDGPGVRAIVTTDDHNVVAITATIFGRNVMTVVKGTKGWYVGNEGVKECIRLGLIRAIVATPMQYLQCCLVGAAHTV